MKKRICLVGVLALGLLTASCGGGGNEIDFAPNPELTLVTTANPAGLPSAGQVISFTYAVTNTGNVPINGPITITDDLVGNESCPNLTTVGDGDAELDFGETILCTSSYTVTAQDVTAGSVVSSATASGTDSGGAPVMSATVDLTVTVPLLATFVADPPSADPRISMEAGASAGDIFDVEIHASGFTDLYGAAFTLLYESSAAMYLGCEAQGSILAGAANPCDGSVVGGAKFAAELQNGVPGFLNVLATKDGLVGGVPNGTGLLLTLTFQALVEIAPPGEPFEVEAGTSREVVTCPQDLSPCSMPVVPWDGGSLTAVAN